MLIVGASHGIGKALLAQMVNDHQLITMSRTDPNVNHPNVNHFTLDIESGDLPRLTELDTIVYCPGTINLKPFKSLKLDDFRRDFELNVLGAVRVIQEYLPQLKRSKRGNILLFSTVAVQQGMPFHASVASSKAAIEGLTRTLAAEFAPHIRVNCIAPSLTDTPLASRILRNDEARSRMAERHPLKHIIEADTVASMAKYLISSQAASISGQVIGVDAGMSIIRK